jgi:hypothetical protein
MSGWNRKRKKEVKEEREKFLHHSVLLHIFRTSAPNLFCFVEVMLIHLPVN